MTTAASRSKSRTSPRASVLVQGVPDGAVRVGYAHDSKSNTYWAVVWQGFTPITPIELTGVREPAWPHNRAMFGARGEQHGLA